MFCSKRFLSIHQRTKSKILRQPVYQTLIFDKNDDQKILKHSKENELQSSSIFKSPFNFIKQQTIRIFFPRDYPKSTVGEYLSFAQWNIIGSVSGTISGVLSTQALLTALGMTSSAALPLSGTLNWVIKDGLGLLGGVVYASFASAKFDHDPKRLRFLATILLQCSTLLETLTPLMILLPVMQFTEVLSIGPNSATPTLMNSHLNSIIFLSMASISNIGKNIAWLALSGTRAKMNSSFCNADNLGDITAKSGSQSTAASLLGTGLGVLISSQMANSFSNLFLMFLPLSLINIYSVYKSNLAVSIGLLNIQRTERIINEFLTVGIVPSPDYIKNQEIFTTKYRTILPGSVQINPSISEIAHLPTHQLSQIFQKDSKYFITTLKNERYGLWFSQDARSWDQLKGFYHVSLCRYKQRPVVDISSFGDFYKQLEQQKWNVRDLFLTESTQDNISIR